MAAHRTLFPDDVDDVLMFTTPHQCIEAPQSPQMATRRETISSTNVEPSTKASRHTEAPQVSPYASLKTLFSDNVEPYDVCSRILKRLSIPDIYALHGVCRSFRHILDNLRKTRWNINARLERFVTDGRFFRELMGEHAGIIAGGFALDLFVPGSGPGERPYPHMHMFFGPGQGIRDFARYLQEEEGYQRSGTAGEDGGAHYGDEGVCGPPPNLTYIPPIMIYGIFERNRELTLTCL